MKFEYPLTVTASHKNRLILGSDSTEWFIKSVQWQTYKDFEFVIADGGSDNYEELKEYFDNLDGDIPMRMVQHNIGDTFQRALLNNVGVRNAKGEYVMTTDVDMFFAPTFMEELMGNVGERVLVESRTMYWKSVLVNKIYSGELDPYNDLESCKKGRIKKRTTAGGCQCMRIDSWHKIRGFDERYLGWGSEDYDLLTRAQKAKIRVKWMGESREAIKLFHMPHKRPNLKKDLEDQEENKKLLNNIKSSVVNPDGWGGK